jgi:hypothetical protein
MKLIIDIPDEQYEYIKLSDKNTFADVSSKECMLYAIKNGTPVSTEGDLISRDALKEEFAKHTDSWGDLQVGWDYLIDNAPAVDPNKELKELKARAETYKAAYRIMSSAFEGEVRKNKRQQGEWEKCQNDTFRCSNCRQADEVPTAMGTPIYNFCPNCGSDMRKGGTE